MPVINENDTVATTEIRYGDNDRLAARVASMASADLLVLLSDVDGLYDAPPAANAQANFIAVVDRITPAIEEMAGAAASHLSRGGMQTKIEAAKIATQAGTHMLIASGRVAPSPRGDRAGHPLHMVSHRRQPRHGAKEMDRRHARAEGNPHNRCWRRGSIARREEPFARGRV